MDPYVPNVTSLCLQYIKYDPNYNHDSDEDEEQMETEDSEFSEQGRWTACCEGERGRVAKAGAPSGLPGWMLLFSSCEEGSVVILLPAQLNSWDQKYLGKETGLYSTHSQWYDGCCWDAYVSSVMYLDVT